MGQPQLPACRQLLRKCLWWYTSWVGQGPGESAGWSGWSSPGQYRCRFLIWNCPWQVQNLQSWYPSLSPKASRLHRTRKSWCLRLKAICVGGGVSLLVYPDLQPIGCGPPKLWRAICLTQSTNLNVNCIHKHTLRHIQNNVWPMGTPWLSQVNIPNLPSRYLYDLATQSMWPVDQQHLYPGVWAEPQALPQTYWNSICILTRPLGNMNAH